MPLLMPHQVLDDYLAKQREIADQKYREAQIKQLTDLGPLQIQKLEAEIASANALADLRPQELALAQKRLETEEKRLSAQEAEATRQATLHPLLLKTRKAELAAAQERNRFSRQQTAAQVELARINKQIKQMGLKEAKRKDFARNFGLNLLYYKALSTPEKRDSFLDQKIEEGLAAEQDVSKLQDLRALHDADRMPIVNKSLDWVYATGALKRDKAATSALMQEFVLSQTPQGQKFLAQKYPQKVLSEQQQLVIERGKKQIDEESKREAQIAKDASDAQQLFDKLNFALVQLNKGNVRTGPVDNIITSIQSIGTDLGLVGAATVDKIAETKGIIALANDLVLKMSERMSGALSEKDMDFLQQATLNPNLPEEANQYILQSQIAFLERAKQKARMLRKFKRDTQDKYKLEDFEEEWDNYLEITPIALNHLDKKTTRPMFFDEFRAIVRQDARDANQPLPTEQKVLNNWRGLAKSQGRIR